MQEQKRGGKGVAYSKECGDIEAKEIVGFAGKVAGADSERWAIGRRSALAAGVGGDLGHSYLWSTTPLRIYGRAAGVDFAGVAMVLLIDTMCCLDVSTTTLKVQSDRRGGAGRSAGT